MLKKVINAYLQLFQAITANFTRFMKLLSELPIT